MAAPATAFASKTSNPPANRSMSRATLSACWQDPSGSSCISSALADINSAHAAEGVPAMVLPSNFASMSMPVQLLNLANLERVDRGLVPILGLSAALNKDAQRGAAQNTDPMPTHFYGNMATSNWAGGYGSALETDFEWMYDDGENSGNLDCTSSDQSGCWGHRQDILWRFSAPIAMGAGYTASGQYGPSMTELFVGGDTRTGPGQPDAPVVRPTPVRTAGGASAAAATAGRHSSAAPRARVTGLTPAGSAVRLTVGCAGARGSVCKLNLTVTVPGRTGQARSVAIAVKAGHRRVMSVSLEGSAKRLLEARHHLLVRVVLTRRGGAGARPLLVRAVTLRTSA